MVRLSRRPTQEVHPEEADSDTSWRPVDIGRFDAESNIHILYEG